jgi:DNA-binding NarL/FixJ family response regulator
MKQSRNSLTPETDNSPGLISVAHVSVSALAQINNELPTKPQSPARIKVALVLQDTVLEDSIAQLFKDSAPDIHVVGAYSSTLDVINAMPAHQPDAVILTLHTQSGIDDVQAIKNHLPQTQLLLLSATDDADSIFKALLAGASSYLLTKEVDTHLTQGLREIVKGGPALNTHISRKVMLYFQKRGTIQPAGEAVASLSQREREVLALLSEQLAYKEIATQLHISVETVRRHCHNIYEKLHVSSRTAAMLKYKES